MKRYTWLTVVTGVFAVQLTARLAPHLNWEPVFEGASSSLNQVVFDHGKFVAVGHSGLVLHSRNGIKWSAAQSPVTMDLQSVVKGGDEWIAVGKGGTILISDNGERWEPATVPVNVSLNSVNYGLGQFIAVGSNGAILRSSDEFSWEEVKSGVDSNLHVVVFGGGLFVAAGEGGIVIVSSDLGESWTPVETGESGEFSGLLWSHGKFWAALTYQTDHPLSSGGSTSSIHGALLESENGLSWRRVFNATLSSTFGGLAVAGDLFVVIGEGAPNIGSPEGVSSFGQSFYVSLGGKVWEQDSFQLGVKPNQPNLGQMRSIAFGSGSFIVVGDGNVILRATVSADERRIEQNPVPLKAGETFVLENYESTVTQNDLGFNRFSGNSGMIQNPAPFSSGNGFVGISVVTDSEEDMNHALRMDVDFTGQPESAFAGLFHSLFGLTDTKVSLDGNGMEPENSTRFPYYYLDFDNLFGAFRPMEGRSIERIAFDTKLPVGSEPITLKIELRDESDKDVFSRVILSTEEWATAEFKREDFNRSVSNGGFDWNSVSVLSVIVEKSHKADGISNPSQFAFYLDNFRLIDEDGEYPDLRSMEVSETKSLNPNYREAFLDLVRARSFQYFIDFASTDPRTGGIISDRSTFPDLMTVGGVGFQLTAYVVGAKEGYITRQEAAERTRSILRVLHDYPQGPERVGTIGYQGFFYHFLGIDGLRKLNFDFRATEENDESLNTVELSPIDTGLAMMGVITVSRYFTGSDSVEQEIRSLADAIYFRVNWPFMLATLDNDRKQFYLGWKPNEERDDDTGELGRFKLDDDLDAPKGQYSSKWDESRRMEVPATLDYYTDEALLLALLAMASPNPEYRLSRDVWDDLIRDGEPFVKTWPGAMFTYQFFSAWVDTQKLGSDNHPSRPVDFFANTREAILETRRYVIDNPFLHTTLNEHFWGLTAFEGPFDHYSAHSAPGAAFATASNITPEPFILEAEAGSGDGSIMSRHNASGARTRWLHEGESVTLSFDMSTSDVFDVEAIYSNDGPSDVIELRLDDKVIGTFTTTDTRASEGSLGTGWNTFNTSGVVAEVKAEAGHHTMVLKAVESDQFGVELDAVYLKGDDITIQLDNGTVAAYGMASSIVHAPSEATSALWTAANLKLNPQTGRGNPMFHPRFGFADAFNLEIADAYFPGQKDAADRLPLRTTGSWLNPAGFAIDHGPTMIMIDNYLSNGFISSLFMSHPEIQGALGTLFPSQRRITHVVLEVDGRLTLHWINNQLPCVIEFTERIATPNWQAVTSTLNSNNHTLSPPSPSGGFFRILFE